MITQNISVASMAALFLFVSVIKHIELALMYLLLIFFWSGLLYVNSASLRRTLVQERSDQLAVRQFKMNFYFVQSPCLLRKAQKHKSATQRTMPLLLKLGSKELKTHKTTGSACSFVANYLPLVAIFTKSCFFTPEFIFWYYEN